MSAPALGCIPVPVTLTWTLLAIVSLLWAALFLTAYERRLLGGAAAPYLGSFVAVEVATLVLFWTFYQPRPDEVILIHTEVEPRFGDMGVGSALARGTLEQLRQRGDRVLVRCPFITAYLRRHPEYADLAVPE